jgi:hypothetical protein
VLAVAAGISGAASGAVSQHASSAHGLARGKITTAQPRAGAAARIRALGLDESGGDGSSDDGGGLATSAHLAHGTIGGTAPIANAAARIAALGSDD